MPSVLKFNANTAIRAKLTPHGKKILDAYLQIGNTKKSRVKVNLDEEGKYTCPLWEFMSIFGPHMHQGVEPCFDITVELIFK
jgi:hypothetical protein